MTEFRYDTQLLIEGHDLDEDAINDYFVEHFRGVPRHREARLYSRSRMMMTWVRIK